MLVELGTQQDLTDEQANRLMAAGVIGECLDCHEFHLAFDEERDDFYTWEDVDAILNGDHEAIQRWEGEGGRSA